MQSGARREWSDAQRRARLVKRHHLSPATRADSPEQVAGSLAAIHSTDPATVFLSVGARLRGDDPAVALETALYETKSLIRMHGMRKTIFVFPAELRPVIHASTTSDNAVKQRADLIRDLQTGDASWDAAWLEALEADVLAYLAEAGEANGTAISKAVPRLRQNLVYGVGTKNEAAQGLASRVLRGLGNENRIVRGRPLGSWTSGQYRWSLATAMEEIDPSAARTELVRRWLVGYGPGTADDLKWWTGWAMRDVRAALANLDIEEVQLVGGTGYVLAGDGEPEGAAADDIALLPALDSTAMGYRQREFYLDSAHVPALFDYAGNIGPTIWWGGRIAGGWSQRKNGEIAWRWLADVPPEANAALEREIERLTAWVGPVRFTPRFRTPLERELSA
jgi:hypothetical protein